MPRAPWPEAVAPDDDVSARYGWVRLLFVVGVLGVLIVSGFGVYLLSVAGDLPWQVDPTRIPITPFADAPGFTPPKIIVATPTGP